MYILVNEQQIEIKDKKVNRSSSDGRVILTVYIPKQNITADELDVLCDYIKDNEPKIVIYDDDGEKVETLTGFKLKARFARNEDGTVWNLIIENRSELEYQYGLLLDRAEALEKLTTDQAAIIERQNATIDSLNQQLLVVQLAAADLYEQSLAAESTEENTEESEPEDEPAETETELEQEEQ